MVSEMFAVGVQRDVDVDKAVLDICRACKDTGVSLELVKVLHSALVQHTTPSYAVHMLMCASPLPSLPSICWDLTPRVKQISMVLLLLMKDALQTCS